MDEATSALDNVTESIVMKNVLAQVNDAAVIAIAHRLASIRDFDKIYVFREGGIVGSGTFAELLEKNAYFQELYQKEMLVSDINLLLVDEIEGGDTWTKNQNEKTTLSI